MFSIISFFIVYFDYMLSVVGLLSCLCICSYSAHRNVLGVGDRYHVSMVLRWYLPANTLYMPGYMEDREGVSPVESFWSPLPACRTSRTWLRRKSLAESSLSAMFLMCGHNGDLNNDF